MDNLTQRQEQLLKAIIEEFIKTACAVGSIDLPNKYNLNISSATIRNEMAKLMEMGYLEKEYSSSGRIPTTLAFKIFLNWLNDELENINIKTQVYINEQLFQNRFDLDNLFLTIVKNLADLTNNASLALVGKRVYRYGLDKLMRYPEFQDLEILQKILKIFDDYSKFEKLLSLYKNDDKIRILIGEEMQDEQMKRSAIVFAPIRLYGANKNAYIAIFGPNRMNYKKIIPLLQLITNKLSEILRDWRKDEII